MKGNDQTGNFLMLLFGFSEGRMTPFILSDLQGSFLQGFSCHQRSHGSKKMAMTRRFVVDDHQEIASPATVQADG